MKPTEEQVDAAATDLVATLETMLGRLEDHESATLGTTRRVSVWNPAVRCDRCRKPISGVVFPDGFEGSVLHAGCV